MKVIQIQTVGSLLFFALLSVSSLAQQPIAGKNKLPAGKTSQTSRSLTVDEVIDLVAAGVSDDVIVTKLQKQNHAFDLSSDDLIRLKKANVANAVIKAMMDPSSPRPSFPAPTFEPQIPIQLPGSNSSGATPTYGTNPADPNDPLTPHDSGIYLFTKDHDGKQKMIVLERAAYQGAKTGGMLASAMTYGIVKAKTKALIPGPHANIRVNSAPAEFYFYFDDKQAGLGKSYFGVSNLSNPNQFSLLKLEVNKSNRETTVGQFSALGTSSGSDEKALIAFKSERIRPGLYKVTVEGLLGGEYCFVASQNQTAMVGIAGAYGAGAASAADIFDFGVNN